MIAKDNIKDLYPLSAMQEGMLFHALDNPESSAYFEQVSWQVRGPLNPPLFEEAWNFLFERHDILRTAFLHERTKRPLQVVLKERKLPVCVEDLADLGAAAQAAEIAARRAREKLRGFDLRNDSLLRARILLLGADRFEIILSFHHILMDGWCMGILNSEFLAVYEAYCTGQVPALLPAVPYGRYIQWLERQDREAALRYWTSQLESFIAPSFLPARRPQPGGYRLERIHAELDRETSARLAATAASWGVTIGSLLQTAWAILLSRYTDSDDVVFGTVVSGRPAEIPDVEKILGLFINLIPVRARLHPDEDCRTLARKIHARFLDAIPHSYCPIGEISARSGLQLGLVDHILVFENYPAATSPGTGLLEVTLTDRFEQTNYDLAIVIAPGERIDVAFHFNANAFTAGHVQRMQASYLHTLGLMAGNPALRDTDVLAPAEKLILAAGRGIDTDLPTGMTLTGKFEELAAAAPDAIAVDDSGVRWTYAELNALAEGLAAVLQRMAGLKAEDRVAVLIPRSRWLALAFMGILKAGAVYLPLDPGDPPDRVRFFIEDSGARVLLTAGRSEMTFAVPVIDISTIQAATGTRSRPAADPERLAYAIYTSGSTGLPKAVGISHRAAMNLVHWHLRTFAEGHGSRATLFASPAFDASVWEMLPCLLSGACLYPVPPDDRLDAERLTGFLANNRITHTFVPTAVAEELGRVHRGRLDAVTVLTGGDALKSAKGFARNLYNNYGPTESAVVATSIRLGDEAGPIAIGRPIDNTEILILDSHSRVSPIGVTGELHIASASLARGYLNRPGLTAEKFIPHPNRPGHRMYRTGDLGWRDETGVIFFHGRSDHQLKVNGVRIEPGEIEAALEAHALVAEAAVGLKGNRIVAWIVTSGPAPDPAELSRLVSARLPAAMLPSEFVFLSEMPRTRNGKLDRAALRAAGLPDSSNRVPATPLECELAAIWSEVLGVPVLGINDDFFALGGHSLTVTRAASRVRDRLNVNLPLRAIFEAPTIARLAALLETQPATPVSGDAEPPLVARRREPLRPQAHGANG